MYPFIYVFALLLSNTGAANILSVFPVPATSHQAVFSSITRELTRLGHKNVVITPNPTFEGQENLTEIDVHDVSYDEMNKFKPGAYFGDMKSVMKYYDEACKLLLNIFKEQTAVKEVRDIIEKNGGHFDVLVVEAMTRFALGFAHVVKGPLIAVSSFGAVADQYYGMGAPLHPLLFPQVTAARFYDLSIWERFRRIYGIYLFLKKQTDREKNENIVVRQIFGDGTPALSEIEKGIDMLFINMHRLWEGCRPMPPAVVHLGGLHLQPEKNIPQDLKEYLDSSVHGVIYVSFGTNVDTAMLPGDRVQAVVRALSALPHDVLWKWDSADLPGRTDNIRVSKWLPQADLLRHPKVKLFITQGGQQSTDEAIAAGVPVIGIPMISDQFYNTQRYEDFHIGKRIMFGDLSEETLLDAVRTVIGNKSYLESVVRLNRLLLDQPMAAPARAAWWTRRVLRLRGARHLRAPAASLHWTQYYQLDLILLVTSFSLLVITMLLLLLRKIVQKIVHYCRGREVRDCWTNSG